MQEHINHQTRFLAAGAVLVAITGASAPCAAADVEAPGRPAVPSAESLPVEVEPGQMPASAPSSGKRWYGWQTLLSDGTALTFALTAGIVGSTEGANWGGQVALAGGTAIYALGAPAVHAAHGNMGRGLGSLGLRIALPGLGMVGGFLIDAASCDDMTLCGVGGGIIGLGMGGTLAMAIDASVLAYDYTPAQSSGASLAPETLSVAPFLARDRAGLSFQGAF